MALVSCSVVNEEVCIYTASGLETTGLPPYLVLNNKEEGFIYLELLGKENGLIKCGLSDAYDISNLFEGLFQEDQLVSEEDLANKGYHHFEKESKNRYKQWLSDGLRNDFALIQKHLTRIEQL